jgi:hypothetical protein
MVLQYYGKITCNFHEKVLAKNILAGFIAWFLAKSIHETKGFFWAWLIHFVQDVMIMTALFLTLT